MEFDRRRLAETVAGVGTIIIIPFLINSENTKRVIESFSTGRVDCAAGIEPQSRDYPFDAIIIPGAGTIRSNGEEGQIFSESEAMRLTAAAYAFQQRVAPKTILLNGKASDGLHNQTQAYFRQELKRITNDSSVILEDAITVEDTSINTSTNMEELAKLAKKHSLRKVLIITNAYHQVRATLLACANGIAASSLSAEQQLTQQNAVEFEPQIKRLYASPKMGITLIKEKLEILWLLWDHKGSLLTKLAQMKIK